MEWDGVRGRAFPLKGVLEREVKLGQELLRLISCPSLSPASAVVLV